MRTMSSSFGGMVRLTSLFGIWCAVVLTIQQSVKADERADHYSQLSLTNQDGKVVDFYDLIKGKTVLINFMYTRCDGVVCGQGTQILLEVQTALGESLGRDVFIYSITLDPEHDTPEVLKAYANSHGVKPGWTFLTGKVEDITKLRRKLGMFDSDPKREADRAQHTGMIKIGNEAISKWASVPVQSTPERVEQIIKRVGPPGRQKR